MTHLLPIDAAQGGCGALLENHHQSSGVVVPPPRQGHHPLGEIHLRHDENKRKRRTRRGAKTEDEGQHELQ